MRWTDLVITMKRKPQGCADCDPSRLRVDLLQGAGSVDSDGGVQGVGIAVGIGDYDLLRAGG